MLKISVLVSGGGTNFQSVIDAVESGFIPDAKIVQVISSSPKAYALERAKNAGIESLILTRGDCGGQTAPSNSSAQLSA